MEIDGEWRVVIADRYVPGLMVSYIVEPIGMRHGRLDR